MRKPVLTLIMWLLLGMAGGYTQVQVSPVDPENAELMPGEIKTIVINVVSQSEKDQSISAEILMPKNWQTVNMPKEFSLPSNKSKVLLISIVPHKYAANQNYSLTLKLKDKVDGTPLGEWPLTIGVKEFTSINVRATSVPDYVLAGTSITTQFIVENSGNSTQKLQLEGKNCSLSDKVDQQLEIEPGKSKTVSVLVQTSENLGKISRMSFRLDALIGPEDNIATAYQHLNVYPTKNLEKDNTFRLPGHLSLSYVGRKTPNGEFQYGIQGEFSLRGNIDRNGKHHVEILMRGPDQFNISGLGQFAEYSLRYQNEKLDMRLGDQSFYLTPLTENARFGRGINLYAETKKIDVGGFFLKPRFYTDLQHEFGTFMKYHFGKKHFLQLNYLNKQLPEETGVEHLVSLSTKVTPLKETIFNGELSYGRDARGTLGRSALVQLESNLLKNINFFGQVLWADPDFPGYFRNSLNMSGRLFYRPSEKLDFSIQVQKDDQNAALDTLFGVAPAINRKSVGIGYRVNKSSRFLAQFRIMESQDKMPDERFHIENRSARINWNYRKSRWNFSLSGEWGEGRNFKILPEVKQSQTIRGSFTGGYRPSKFIQFSLLFQYANQDFYLLDGTQQLIYGASASTSLNSGTDLRFHIQNSYLISEYFRDRDLFSIQIRQKINKYHYFDITGRYALLRRTVNSRDLAFSARYVWQFGIPLEKVERGQTIMGQVTGTKGQSLKGIIFYLNGQVAITDKEGQFKFEGIKPGQYPLLIDNKSIGIHQITDQKMPLTVDVRPEQTSHINIGITEGVGIAGRVVIKEDNSPGPNLASKTNELGIALIEIQREEQIIRQVTDGLGRFDFSNLQPGTWTVKLLHGEIGKRFTLKESKVTLELLPGDKEEVIIELIPKRRNIKFSNFMSIKKND